jgi:hypothetical protein
MNDAASSCVQHGLQTITMASKLASTDIPGWCESRAFAFPFYGYGYSLDTPGICIQSHYLNLVRGGWIRVSNMPGPTLDTAQQSI